jgi:cellulose synthase/poly-beta-1,6-N-acetylglucosamine synthase-like glycosyltransferase
VNALLTVLAVVIALPGAAAAVHLGLLTGASVFYRSPRRPDRVPHVSFLVLVPAHNEEAVLGDTLEAINADRRPRDQVLVVADRCSDATAEIAARAGALVLERPADAEPGRAASRQDGIRRALTLEWDAMVMIDADSTIERGFFDECEAGLASGAQALQARSEAAVGKRLLDQLALAAVALQGVALPRGRSRLGFAVRLFGSGMVLSRHLVTKFQFRAPASEDLYYSLDLLLTGVVPRYIDAARLRSQNVGSWRAAGSQRTRYEAGRMAAAREFVGPLLRRHNLVALEAAWFLLTPPFALAALLLVCGVAVAFIAGATPVLWVCGGLLGVLAGSLMVGLVVARAGLRTWLALAIAPWYMAWKAIVQVRALLSLSRGVRSYGATPRQ